MTKLIFKGIVQGVGFRPTVYRVAQELGLKGYVLNKGAEVEVVIDRNIEEFLHLLQQQLPPIAHITDIQRFPDKRTFSDFNIRQSKNGERKSQIPPDIAICDTCLREVFTSTNRRYLFPFTNCTLCGARYSLITDVPYDRERTAMKPFHLCKKCKSDYSTISNRRYHAQTISCPTCGPVYHLYDKEKRDLGQQDVIQRFAQYLDQGSIGVIKSWGGMHLCCNLTALKRFRKWYRRPQKAFALMVRDIAIAKHYGCFNKNQSHLLLSWQRPIVLVEKKQADLVSPGLNTIGIYLPYTGLQHMLFSYLKADALVMTSANIPGEPMIIDNDEVFSLGADFYLLHTRMIPNRVDDSVVKEWCGHTFFLRKSRGYVPEPITVPYKHRVVSVGADENIVGAVSIDSMVYATQYIGNASYYPTVEFLEQSIRHLMHLFMEKPGVDGVAMDLHPGYDSRRVAYRFAEEFSAPIVEVQHDWAHAASLLVDTDVGESVVLVLEGLGYGCDGTFWGSEVLHADFTEFHRVGHFEYLPLLGGDMATRDPRRLVFAIFQKFGREKMFHGAQAQVLSRLLDTSPLSCSFGRYLDALSCYLGICCERTYSGEPAMKLEKYLAVGKQRYRFDVEIKKNVVHVLDLFRQLDDMLPSSLTERVKADAAYSFVKTMVDALTDIAVEYAIQEGVKTIGVSGGVSYNIPIVELIKRRVLTANLTFLVHNRIPNGDGGIAIGQNVIASSRLS